MIAPLKSNPTFTDIETYLRTWKSQAIERSSSFPTQMYTSEQVYQLELERFLGKLWLYAGHISQLPEPGSYFTLTLAEQPLLITRDLDGHLHGFFNVCTHRAGPIALGRGICNRFTCQYHAWTFDHCGALRAAPYMDSAQDFDYSDYALTSVQVDTWGPFIFVNLDPNCAPLDTQLGALPALFQRYRFSDLVKVQSIDYELDVNWKLYVENSSESYHATMVHPALELFKNLSDIEMDVQHHYYREYIPFLPNSPEIRYGFKPGLTIEGLSDREMQGTSVTMMWPNFVMVTCPNFVLVRMINPQGLSRTHVRFDWLVPDTEEARAVENVSAVVELYDKTVKEDLAMLNTVQQRVRSLNYTPGRLSPALEVGTHRFQHALMEYIRQPTCVP